MSRNRVKLVLLTLTIGGFAGWLHWPAVRNGFVDWDDYLYLNEAERHHDLSLRTIRWAFTSVQPFYYHPLTRLSHALDVRLWGWNPALHHATNVLFHAVNTGLVVGLIWSLTAGLPSLSAHVRMSLAAVAALVFGIHPLQVESVAWLSERKNLLCGLFSLACLWAYARGARRSAFALFVPALLSKPTAVSLPAVMLALDFYPLQRNEKMGWRRLLAEKSLMIAFSAVIAVATIASSRGAGVTQFGPLQRLAVAARGLMFYLWKLAWPCWLSPYYPLEGTIPTGDPEFVASVAMVITITAFAIWKRKRMPALLAAWLVYVVLILPVSGLLQNGAQAAGDRFMYLAVLAPTVVATWGGIVALRQLRAPSRAALAVLLAGELCLFGFTTRAQIPVWRNDMTLWSEALGHFPNSALANFMMASGLARQKRYEEALPFAVKSVILSPNFARAQYGLACVYSRLGQTQESLDTLRRAVAYNPSLSALAAHDEDLATLRNDPRLAAQFGQLVGF